jgi:hypothetical protein
MNRDPFDPAPAVQAWLKEPIWLPESDLARIALLVHQTPQQRGWASPLHLERMRTMFSATKLVAAGVIVATFGGFLLASGVWSPQTDQRVPAAAETVEPTTSAAPTASAASPLPQASTAPAEPSDTETSGRPLVFDEASGESLGSWSQAGITDGGRYGLLQDLQVVGDRLVVLSSVSRKNRGVEGVVLVSSDGRTWQTADVPGDTPRFEDLAASPDGLLLGGSVQADGKRAAQMWSTPDGITWTPVEAPDARQIDQIVSTDSPRAVVSGQRLWVDDGSGWAQNTRLVNMSIARGPGGFLAWQGGGQDIMLGTTMTHASDLSDWHEVGLPGALGRGEAALGGLQLFVVGDQWVLVPSEAKLPDTMYVSSDGLDWQEVPRPSGLMEGEVEWMAQVGDTVQAFGQTAADGSSGLWTFDLGQAGAEFEVLDPSGDAFIDSPVAFAGGQVALGMTGGPGIRTTLWATSPES